MNGPNAQNLLIHFIKPNITFINVVDIWKDPDLEFYR